MKKYFLLIPLALLTMTCAVVEGLVESLSPQFIQISGLLTLVCVLVFVIWSLKIPAQGFKKDR